MSKPPSFPARGAASTPEQRLREAGALRRAGRLDEAETIYRALLKLYPTSLDGLHGLGRLCLRGGRPKEAEKWLKRAVALTRQSADLYCDLGAAVAQLARHAEAIRNYQASLKIAPEHALAHYNMGTALHALGRPAEAIGHFEQAIGADPGLAEARDSLGLSLAALNRHAEALACHEKAVGLRPGLVLAHCNASLALLALNRPAEALAHSRSALAIKPDHADGHFAMGVAFEALGNLEDARTAYTRAVELAPSWGRAHRGLADCTGYSAGHPHLALMESVVGDPKVHATDRVHLHAALAKAYGDLNDHVRASRHMLDGNRLQRQTTTYDEAATLAVFDRVIATFTPRLIGQRQGLGARSRAPIFVVGMPRSGSTLVEQILASHPSVHGAGEIPQFGDAVASLGRGHFGSEGFLSQVASMSGADLRRIGERYLADISHLADGKSRIVNKLPGNFVALGLIHLALPDAIVIHSRRDPIDTSLSRFSKIFVPGQAYGYDLGELGRYHRGYDRLMAHWRETLPAATLVDVDYEAVVADLEAEARRLIAACGLEWDEACLAFHRSPRPVMTPSRSQVRQPIYATSVGRWRPYQEMLRPLLDALGGQ